MFTSSHDKKIAIIDLTTNQVVWEKVAHDDIIYGLAISPNNQLLASGGGTDNMLKIWKIFVWY